MKKTLLPLFLFLGITLYLEAQDYSIPPTTEAWSQFFNASVVETADGIVYGSAGTRNGNAIMSNDIFDLSGKTVKIKWRFNGGTQRSYFRGVIRIYQTSPVMSFPSTTTLVDNKWYYTTLTVNENKSYNYTTATNNYLADGGVIVESAVSGTFLDDQWHSVTNASILLYWDDAGADTQLTIAETTVINSTPKNIQTVHRYDFEDGIIPEKVETTGAWQVVDQGNDSDKSLYISGVNGNRLTLTDSFAVAVRMDIKTEYLSAVRLAIVTNGTRWTHLSDYENGTPNITGDWQTVTIPIPHTGDYGIYIEFYTEYSSAARQLWVDNIEYLNEIDQPAHVQSNWSGGEGQEEAFVDTSMFFSQSNINFSSDTGEVSGQFAEALSYYGMVSFNGKMVVGTTQGVFLYDTLSGEWDMMFDQPIERLTIHDDKLYGKYGLQVYTYDGSEENYGYGYNGWKLHSELSTTFGAIYCMESINGEFMIGSRYNSGSAGCVLVWNGTSWVQRGGNLENGVLSLGQYNGETFAGTHWGSDIYRWNGSAWTEILNPSLMTCLDFQEFNGELYAAMYSSNYVTGAIYKYDGSAWSNVYNGSAIVGLTVADDSIYAIANTSAGSSILVSSDGSSYSSAYPAPLSTETHIYQIASDSTNVYYGGRLGTPTGDFYKNGQVINRLASAELISSQLSLTGSQIVTAELTTELAAYTGVKVSIKGVNTNTTNWQDISNGNSIDINDSLLVYKLELWSAAVDSTPTVTEIAFLEKPEQSIVFDSLDDKTYGDTSFELRAQGGESGLSLNYTSSDTTVVSLSDTTGLWLATIHNAGSVIISVLQEGGEVYAPTDGEQPLSITKADLVVDIDNEVRLKGEANPVFTYSITGFVNEEDSLVIDALPSLSSTADESSNVGDYDIVGSGASDDNYTFTYNNGILTVDLATGMGQQKIKNAWPNPTTGILHIDAELGTRYTVVSLSGRVMKEGVISHSTLDITTFNNGLYLLTTANSSVLIIKE